GTKMHNSGISWLVAAFGGVTILLGGCAVEAPDAFSDLDSSQESANLDPAPEDVRETVQKAVIKISTLAQLRAMSPTGDYELSGNINASATSTTAFVPIGSSTTPFSGSFDGKGYKISNLKIAGNRSYAGLFGYASSANIENVKL